MIFEKRKLGKTMPVPCKLSVVMRVIYLLLSVYISWHSGIGAHTFQTKLYMYLFSCIFLINNLAKIEKKNAKISIIVSLSSLIAVGIIWSRDMQHEGNGVLQLKYDGYKITKERERKASLKFLRWNTINFDLINPFLSFQVLKDRCHEIYQN